MIRALWFCSWYPNEEDRFTGDFIQRQARAVSKFADLDVYHVVESYEGRQGLFSSEYNDQLREHIEYIPCAPRDRRSKPPRLVKYLRAYVHFLKEYIKVHGKPDLIHVQVPMKAGLIALYAKKRWQIPYIVTEHYGIYSGQVEDAFVKRGFFFRYFSRKIIQEAKFLTTVSFSLGKEINEAGIKKRFKVVPNVVDTELFKPGLHPTGSVFRFIHISNMAPIKNVKGILQAVKQLTEIRTDFELHLIGAEPPELIELARELEILNRQVFFRGEIPYTDVALAMRQSEALIVFSENETQSCVALEALCSGKPLIVTQAGGVKELVDERNGFVVKPGDEKALRKAMDKIMNVYDRYQPHEIAAKASARYSYDAVGNKFLRIYERLSHRIAAPKEEELEEEL